MKAKTFFLILTLIFVNPMPSTNAALNHDERVLTHYIDENKTNQLNLLKSLVNINSGTANQQGVKRVGELIRPEFENLGFKTQWIDLPPPMKHAGSLVATHQGPGKRILLIGHLDTVFPADNLFQSFTLSSDHKSATGPGVIDNKGGIVTILYALKALDRAGKLKNANITVVFTGDEEQAAKPTAISRKALREVAQSSDIALGFEFALAANQLVTSRRGLSEWYLFSHSKARHSSTIFEPGVGFGAIYEIARVLNVFRATFSDIPGLTLNPGIMLGGQTINENVQQGTGNASGQKTITAVQALVHGDLRFLSPAQKSVVEQKMHKIVATSLPLTSSKLTFNDIIPVMPETDANRQLLAQFSTISVALGGEQLQAVPAAKRGGADISYIAQHVSASLDGLGPWGSGAHSHNETIDLSSLPIVTKRAAIFLNRYLNQ